MEHPPRKILKAADEGKLDQLKTSVLKAADEGKLEQLKKCASELDHELGVGLPTILGNIRNEDSGRRALHFAAAGGRLDVLKYLIEDMKLNIDVQDNSGETPMCCAAIEGRLSTVAYLLKMGANPEIPNGTSMIPYLLKMMGDNPEIRNGTDIPMNPLHHAAVEGHHDIITLLLSKGVNVDVSNGFGSPLLHACAVGRHDTVKLLLDHNANPNWLFGEATTPLLASIYSKSWQCVESLLKAGADPNGGPDGMEALASAAGVGTIPIIKLLVEAGADPNVTNTYGLKPVEVAARDGNRQVVEILFPVTSPIPSYVDWSVDGVMEHVNSEKFKKMFREDNEIFFLDSKSRGTSAFRRRDYSLAVHWYTEALKTDPTDAAVLSNRSLCFVYLNKGNSALKDATQCVLARPDWPKAHYRKGIALKLLNRLDDAADAFLDGLKLDPENKELEAAFREVSLGG